MAASILNLGPYRYRPTRQLDETRMSTLWLASEVTRESTASPGNLVIIKIARMSDTQYSLTNQRAIENEEKWLGKLEHPNIIRLRTVAEREASRQPIFRARSDLPGNPWFLVTDYLPGGDLQSLLNERQKLPASLALEIAEQLGDALTYLHARRCIHCDIKPRNILFHEQPAGYGLTDATRPILIDFGIAKNPSDGPQLASGTPRWITPELHEALRIGRKIEVDPSWDVYAAGLVLYTMMTGRKPELDRPGSHSWTPLAPGELSDDTTVIQERQLAEGLNRLIAGATADRSADRVQAIQFADEVRRLQQHVRKPGATPVVTRSARRASKGFWLAGIGVAAAMVLAGVLLFANSSQLPPGAGGPTPPGMSASAAFAGEEGAIPPGASPTATATTAALAQNAKPPTSTPIDTSTPTVTRTATHTPTRTPVHTPTATETPRGATATSTRVATVRVVTATPASVASAGGSPTSTPVTGTSTRVPTSTRTPMPLLISPTSTSQTQATPVVLTAGDGSDLSVTLRGPADNITAAGEVRFSWQPSRALKENECFEVSFWRGEPSNWLNGSGIWGANRDNFATRTFNEEYDNSTGWLEDGATYYWGVLLIEDCQAYANRQPSPRRLVSEVRRFTFDR
ncbi:MAG: protein kinase [Caldilineaceae bacterium]|nr:protein kinase [Caldilineaceae bacterium]